MKSYVIPVVLGLALALAACQPASQQSAAPEGPSKAEVEAALTSLDEAWTTAFNAGDAAAVAEVYADDAIVMPENAPAATGKAAIQASYQSFFDQFTADLTLSRSGAEVAGDWAFTWGTSSGTITPKAGGDPIEDKGKYVVIYQRQPDGSWKAARDIWNSDSPLPGATQE